MNINDIAKLAGVSKSTVSRVINNKQEGMSEETRNKISKIIEEVGYIPNSMARSITVSETKIIGVIIPDVENPFFSQIVRGIEDYAVKKGYTVFLCNSDFNRKKEQNYLYSLLEKRVDGIILNTSGELDSVRLRELLYKSKLPIIVMDRKTNDFMNYPGVFINNEQAAYEGVSYLINKGNKNIVYLGGEKSVYTVQERYKGYLRAMGNAGLGIGKNSISYGKLSIESGYERTCKLLEEKADIDAIFASADVIAIGALKAAREYQIQIPDQIEIMGFDNINLCDIVTPTLSTVGQPIYKIGEKSAKMLIDSIHNKDKVFEDVYLQTKLIIRQSTR
ncbi:LacI family transcriptional regulator [Lachnotalea glycerini]|uniref:LacI family transcriptional regulator n=1 Tax=Lachnotalea glycerini TaxID=1763509 RepID=A0A255I8F2_9FIRM|nr:LacI family DNA-binding transcriptional regulator [Lachnotalea glycerini]PXV86902.1 LacI family transcriptional regulator [Lachnotalea glycerini]RDY30444.1 LacI family transcriptional regulator [Lachnotalea glycerini]